MVRNGLSPAADAAARPAGRLVCVAVDASPAGGALACWVAAALLRPGDSVRLVHAAVPLPHKLLPAAAAASGASCCFFGGGPAADGTPASAAADDGADASPSNGHTMRDPGEELENGRLLRATASVAAASASMRHATRNLARVDVAEAEILTPAGAPRPRAEAQGLALNLADARSHRSRHAGLRLAQQRGRAVRLGGGQQAGSAGGGHPPCARRPALPGPLRHLLRPPRILPSCDQCAARSRVAARRCALRLARSLRNRPPTTVPPHSPALVLAAQQQQ